MKLRNAIVTRLAILYGLLLLVALAVAGNILYIQTIRTDRWENYADNLTSYTVSLEANRGNICADDGNVLATSVPGYYVRIDLGAPGVKRVYAARRDSLATMLSLFFKDKPAAEYRKRLDKAYREGDRGFMLTPRKVDYNELQAIKRFPILRRGAFGGGRIIEQENKRILPLGKLAAKTIGTLNRGAGDGRGDAQGFTGIEAAFEEQLRGKEGVGYRQNLSGRWVSRIEIEPRDGRDVMTNLNIRYQDITESALERKLVSSNAEWGTAILMEVKTGRIKAIANLARTPTGRYEEVYNYALAPEGCMEPGSTFKLVSLLAALDQGLIDTSQVFDTGDGVWKYQGRNIYDSDYGRGEHGPMTVSQIFEKSSNVGVAKIITSCYSKEPEKFTRQIEKMGITRPLGLELKGEGIPVFKQPGQKDWWGTTLAWMSYGYECKMTPLQILTFYNAVANDGKMMKPFIVREIQEKGDVVKRTGPEVLNSSVASHDAIRKARKMLEGVCIRGTGKHLRSDLVTIAGKTGTAQVSAGQGGYGKGRYLASFVGYFPAEKPVYSMIVTVKNPQGAYYGGSVAGPVFREVAEKVYAIHLKYDKALQEAEEESLAARRELPEIKSGRTRDLLTVIRELDLDYKGQKPATDYVKIREQENSWALADNPVAENLVPDVKGMGAQDALFLLESAGLQVRLTGIGRVRNQSLQPGYKFRRGETILLTLG